MVYYGCHYFVLQADATVWSRPSPDWKGTLSVYLYRVLSIVIYILHFYSKSFGLDYFATLVNSDIFGRPNIVSRHVRATVRFLDIYDLLVQWQVTQTSQ